MTFQPLLPWAILAVVAGALVLARLVSLRQTLWLGGRRRGRAVLRWSGVTMAVLLLLAAATRPGLRTAETRSSTTAAAGENMNIFLVVDRSVDDPRIARMRDDIAALIEQYPAARYALIGFTARAALDWPLSEDVWTLRPEVAALGAYQDGPEMNAGAAASIVRYQLIQAGQQYPGAPNVVLYLGSGAPDTRIPQDDFDPPRGSIAGGAVLGYGRGAGIDEDELRKIAGQLAVPYRHRDAAERFHLDVPQLPDGTGTRRVAKRIELYWLPALLAAALLLAEIYVSVREFRRGRIARRDLTRDLSRDLSK